MGVVGTAKHIRDRNVTQEHILIVQARDDKGLEQETVCGAQKDGYRKELG